MLQLLLVLIFSALHPPQKPIVEAPVFREYAGAPRTVAELLDKAESVVIGRITHAQDLSTPERALTEYSVEVVAAIKGPHTPGMMITLFRPIGDRHLPARTIRVVERGLPIFEVGITSLLFLQRVADGSGWAIAYGPRGGAVFGRDGRLQVEDRHLLKDLKGLRANEAVTRLSKMQTARR